MDEERQSYLDGDCFIILGDLRAEDGSACEDELHDYEGGEVEDSPEVVVEEEEFGVIEHLAGLDEALVLGLYYVFAGGKVLSKDFAVVLRLLALLSQVWVFNPDNLWLLGVIHTVQFYLLKHDFSLIIFALEARDKPKFVRLGDGNDDYVDKRDEDDRNSSEYFIICVLRDNDDGGDECDVEHHEVGVLECSEGIVGVELAHVFS